MKQFITLNSIIGFGVRKGAKVFKVQSRRDAAPRFIPVAEAQLCDATMAFTEFGILTDGSRLSATEEWQKAGDGVIVVAYMGANILRTPLEAGAMFARAAYGCPEAAGRLAVRHYGFEVRVVRKLGKRGLALI